MHRYVEIEMDELVTADDGTKSRVTRTYWCGPEGRIWETDHKRGRVGVLGQQLFDRRGHALTSKWDEDVLRQTIRAWRRSQRRA